MPAPWRAGPARRKKTAAPSPGAAAPCLARILWRQALAPPSAAPPSLKEMAFGGDFFSCILRLSGRGEQAVSPVRQRALQGREAFPQFDKCPSQGRKACSASDTVRAGDAHINSHSLHRFPPCEDIVRSKTGYLPMPFYSSKRVFCENAGRFPRLGAFSAKTRRVLLIPARFQQKHAPSFAHPGAFSAKTRGVLLVSACFPQKRGAFSSPRRVFHQNAPRFPCHDAFSAKTRNVLLVPKQFCGKKNRPRLAARTGSQKKLSKITGLFALSVCRAVAPARRGRN